MLPVLFQWVNWRNLFAFQVEYDMIVTYERMQKIRGRERKKRQMTIQECYQNLGGNYEEVLKRMMSPALIQRFIGKFLQDGSYEKLYEEVKAGNREEAFRAAHTLKGVCQNLGLGKLADSSSRMTELLRGDAAELPAEALALLEEISEDYQLTADTIRSYLES